jgi:hypothetical protein
MEPLSDSQIEALIEGALTLSSGATSDRTLDRKVSSGQYLNVAGPLRASRLGLGAIYDPEYHRRIEADIQLKKVVSGVSREAVRRKAETDAADASGAATSYRQLSKKQRKALKKRAAAVAQPTNASLSPPAVPAVPAVPAAVSSPELASSVVERVHHHKHKHSKSKKGSTGHKKAPTDFASSVVAARKARR